jgi:mRNA-degrading endonuclease RelE of RelBE toxin-antitoxin system
MSYQVSIRPAAQRQFKKLTLDIQENLIAIIENLTEEPRPAG